MNQPLAPYQPDAFQKPGMVTAIAIMTLVNGILNILWGLGIAVSLLLSLIGIFCLPIAAYPVVLGILEILYAVKLLSNPPRPVQPAMYLAVMEICDILLLDFISVVVGILALVFYNDPAVQVYFARINAPAQAHASHSPTVASP